MVKLSIHSVLSEWTKRLLLRTDGAGMKKLHKSPLTKQAGQALILGLFLVMGTAMAAVLMYNNGQATTEKARLVNAADAAAYSGAVYFTRNLNFIAYTNRAMIANHVAIGHFISYVSWIRYVQDSLETLKNYTQYIPYVGQAVTYAEMVVSWIMEGTEMIAEVLVPATDVLNKSIAIAQLKSQWSMNGVLSVSDLLNVKIMDKVARTYDPAIRVNYKKEILSNQSGVASIQVFDDIRKTLQYVRAYQSGDDDGRMKSMVEASYDKSRPFITSRAWNINFGLIKFSKSGSTKHSLDQSMADWEASDALVYKRWTVKGWKSTTLASGEASASEFASEYSGVSSYRDLRNLDKRAEQTLNISALATMPINRTRFMSLLGLQPGAERLAALSRAEIYHERPEEGYLQREQQEYANLYNPFWQVRLNKNAL